MLSRSRSIVTKSTILYVTILRPTEVVLGDVAAVKAHTLGMRQLIQAYGGFDRLTPAIAVQVPLADIKAAIVADSQPSFPMSQRIRLQFDMLNAAPCQPSDKYSSTLGMRFFSGQIARRLCPELQQCLRYARHLVLAVETCVSFPDSSTNNSIEDFLFLDHRLLSLPFELNLSHIEDCVRIALLLHTSIGLWKTPPFTLPGSNAWSPASRPRWRP